MEKRIAVAVDGSPTSLAALHWACTLFEGSRDGMLVVHVLDQGVLWGEEATAAYAGATATDLEHLADSWVAESRALEHVVEEVARSYHCHLEFRTITVEPGEGGAAAAFLRVAQQWGAQAVVTGRRRNPGLVDRLLGSFSRWLVAHAEVPVVLVPPPATFRSAR